MQSSQGWMLNPNALMFIVLEEKGDNKTLMFFFFPLQEGLNWTD
jgi:hypothetical protein